MTEVTPKFVSPSHPAPRWTAAPGGQGFFACTAKSLIDLDHAIIVDVETTAPLRAVEITAATRVQERCLAADAGYGTVAMLGSLVGESGIEPRVPVLDKSGRKNGTFAREARTSSTTASATPTGVQPAKP